MKQLKRVLEDNSIKIDTRFILEDLLIRDVKTALQ
jgi:hypothetical protein